MKWHKGADLPNIETDTALCVVQYKYPIPDYRTVDDWLFETHYEVLLFHKDTKSFSEPKDVKGICGLREDQDIPMIFFADKNGKDQFCIELGKED